MDSENSSKIFEILRKKKELSQRTTPVEDPVKFRAGGLQPSRRHQAVPSRSRQHRYIHAHHLCQLPGLCPGGKAFHSGFPGIV